MDNCNVFLVVDTIVAVGLGWYVEIKNDERNNKKHLTRFPAIHISRRTHTDSISK